MNNAIQFESFYFNNFSKFEFLFKYLSVVSNCIVSFDFYN